MNPLTRRVMTWTALACLAACDRAGAEAPRDRAPEPGAAIKAVEPPTYGQPKPMQEPTAGKTGSTSQLGPERVFVDPGAETPMPVAHAVAVLAPTEGHDITGVVRFDVKGDALVANVNLQNVPQGEHAMHFHQYGDCSSEDAKSAGTHFNLQGSSESPSPDIDRITGNIGVLEVGKDGRADATWTIHGASLDGRYGVLGRSVVLHEKGNDASKPPMGAAGARLACGAVGVADDTLFAN